MCRDLSSFDDQLADQRWMEVDEEEENFMYSVILAAMLTTGAAEAQGWHRSAYVGCSCSCSCAGYVVRVHPVRFHGCHGCHGCHGYCYGCTGCGGCGGVYIASCGGCGGCIGSTSIGYSQWGAGCYGTSCYGGCYGGSSWGCAGVSAYAPSMPIYGHSEMPAPDYGTPASTSIVTEAKAPAAAPAPAVATSTKTARVVIMVPTDAKVWVDNVLCPLQGENRAFNTPTLTPGSQYSYNVSVETPDGGRANRRVLMTAGQTVDVDFRATLTARK